MGFLRRRGREEPPTLIAKSEALVVVLLRGVGVLPHGVPVLSRVPLDDTRHDAHAGAPSGTGFSAPSTVTRPPATIEPTRGISTYALELTASRAAPGSSLKRVSQRIP